MRFGGVSQTVPTLAAHMPTRLLRTSLLLWMLPLLALPLPLPASADQQRPDAMAAAPLADTSAVERRRGERRRARGEWSLPTDVAALQQLSVVLGRPSANSICLNLLADKALEAFVIDGREARALGRRSALMQLLPGEALELQLDGLRPDSQHFYQLHYRPAGSEQAFTAAEVQAFHTQRAPGSSFIFELQGDSHPERPQQFDPSLYAQTLRAAAADAPDFYITMGDDFSVDTLAERSAASVRQRYLLQRPFLALIGQRAPLFLVNGNHEQAAAANHDGSPDNVAVWAQTARNTLFPQPAPDGFYSGNSQPVPHIGLLRNYFAWTWGDALFVVIDPYWHSQGVVDNALGSRDKSGRDLWDVSLGEAQYRWLQQTLAQSKARFKFVFAHHVLGTGRGGVEMARLYEWGGLDRRGQSGFAARRPGWELPIHALMVKHGVSIFFQGHDHVYAQQSLDGLIYQTAPQPADASETLYFREAYRSGVLFPNAGRLRVSVTPEKLVVEYLRSRLPSAASAEHPDGEIAHRYELPARQ